MKMSNLLDVLYIQITTSHVTALLECCFAVCSLQNASEECARQ